MFVNFLSEMRHPMDFWKAMIMAQTFITVVYIFFGVFVSCSSSGQPLDKTHANYRGSAILFMANTAMSSSARSSSH